MAKRILTAVIWLPIAALGFAFAPVWAIALAISALSVVAVYELLWATGLVRQKRLCVISAVFAALVPLWTYYSSEFYLLLLGAFLLVSLCFLDGMLHQAKVKFEMVCAALFGALIVPCFLSSFLRMEMEMETRLIFYLPLIYPFISDAGGYFAGRLFESTNWPRSFRRKRPLKVDRRSALCGSGRVVVRCGSALWLRPAAQLCSAGSARHPAKRDFPVRRSGLFLYQTGIWY